MNYTTEEYANEVVYRVAAVCAEKEVAHPILVTESGRALTAYQSVLVVNVLGRSRLDDFEVSEDLDQVAASDVPQPILDLIDAHDSLSERTVIECYHDALQAYEQALDLFKLGYLSLEQRGFAERLFWTTSARIRTIGQQMDPPPEVFEGLERLLADIYYCNFSVFQSLPDSWAIGQLFPIVPIHRLKEAPTRRATLADMTCDSDGRIDRFVGQRDTERTLPLHDLRPDEDYYLGIFLTGAYQETLGDLHNLFGDTHVVHVSHNANGDWSMEEVVEGDTAGQVLGYLQYDVAVLCERLDGSCKRAVADGRLDQAAAAELSAFYRSELEGYTYLEQETVD